MTDELRSLAALALRIVKADIERDGGGTPVFVVRDAHGKIEQLAFPKELAGLMNSGPAKDLIFDTIRKTVRQRGHTAVVIATECWTGKQTEAGKALPTEEFLKYARESGFVTAVEKGYIERSEAITVSVQTAETVLIVTQFFERDQPHRRIVFGEQSEMEFPITEFCGRQKMFGDLKEENLR